MGPTKGTVCGLPGWARRGARAGSTWGSRPNDPRLVALPPARRWRCHARACACATRLAAHWTRWGGACARTPCAPCRRSSAGRLPLRVLRFAPRPSCSEHIIRDSAARDPWASATEISPSGEFGATPPKRAPGTFRTNLPLCNQMTPFSRSSARLRRALRCEKGLLARRSAGAKPPLTPSSGARRLCAAGGCGSNRVTAVVHSGFLGCRGRLSMAQRD
ncbi:hypothetical protein T492DRAFT_1067112 [Pavlovales sp. CCMP2436]|nr:hypothetical protein T492DRAFT_1067112 [Pavlovales sp. CCMP2436]